MKEKYIKPDCAIEEFNTISVITTSSDDNDTPFPWG